MLPALSFIYIEHLIMFYFKMLPNQATLENLSFIILKQKACASIYVNTC